MIEQGEDSFFESICFLIGAAVHEQILLSAVAVVVAVEEDVPAFKRFLHHHFD